ncbi:MAG: 3-dehydroquinate synthase [Alphaproteobacteria bacterium]|nr:3-dehydroquinate synthase [Alphaproteobacteria bacterium]
MLKYHMEIKRSLDSSYDIEIGWDLCKSLVDDIKNNLVPGISRYVLISDSMVSPLYAEQILARLRDAAIDADLLVFPCGERNKTRQTKEILEDRLIAKGHKRDTCLVAVGGGVVSDLTGFVAGTYARGIPYIVYSTTLLSAADASVGGKTAVDTPEATNLIGLFHQPRKVYIDINSWKTLSYREFCSGLSETVKHACLASSAFFEFLEKNRQVLACASFGEEAVPVLERVAFENVRIKSHVVRSDPDEDNFRQVLNLGHTLGRALEALCDFKLTHGECVSIGLAYQAEFGRRLGYIEADDVARIKSLLCDFHLPVELPKDIATKALVDKMYTDKKGKKGQIRMVFQKGIGEMMSFDDSQFSRPMKEDEITALIDEIRNG